MIWTLIKKILRKFWADDLDTDQASDSTLEPDTFTEQQQTLLEAHPEVHEFLSHNIDTAKKGKRGRHGNRAVKNGPGSWAGPLAHIFWPGRA
ncbi:hypothetical protein MtrunA17_Chr8g0337691 [Medicago truncatula]|uniref:Uncharacterized protein n=1 Tax=Medicago truncatula TaxID=3880 RepID=A0A396GC33_MEDTR|nr:hypothetical protein MtrunA17_Chr8g0337691 [Medicago truncatula]